MATEKQIGEYSKIIYDTAVAGTKNTKGLPPPLALLLVAQAKHETGNFTSRAFLEGRNAFGYSFVRGGVYQLPEPGRIADNGQPLAKYASLQDSTREVVDWIGRRQREGKFPIDLSIITTAEQYARYLKAANYYGDSLDNYTRGLKRWFVELGDAIRRNPGASAGVALFVIGMLALLVWRGKVYAVK